MILSLTIYEQGIYFHLFRSPLISHNSVLQFSVQRLHLTFIKFIPKCFMSAYKLLFLKVRGLEMPSLQRGKTVPSSILPNVLFVYSSRVSLTPVTFSGSERKVLNNHFVRENILCLLLFKILLWIPISIPVRKSYKSSQVLHIHLIALPGQLITSPPTVANIPVTLASLLFLKFSRQNPIGPLIKCLFCL